MTHIVVDRVVDVVMIGIQYGCILLIHLMLLLILLLSHVLVIKRSSILLL